MAVATSLPSKNVVIRFPSSTQQESSNITSDELEENYQLLELPAEILKAVETTYSPIPLTIKGKPSDDAVLCTPNSTFLLRAVTISNSLLICRPPTTDDLRRPTLEIRDISHEIIECVPQASNLERIRKVLVDSAWQGIGSNADEINRKRKRGDDDTNGDTKRWTRAQLESVIQASDDELERGLKERNVVEVEGKMLFLPLKHLSPVLSLILTLLTIHSTKIDLPKVTAPLSDIERGLAAQDLQSKMTRPIMTLFGDFVDDEWVADVASIAGEIGKSLLEGLKGERKRVEVFMEEWREAVGDSWTEILDLKLLEGDYLLTQPTSSSLTSSPLISYFPLHQLPLHAATRFSDLFLTRTKWRPEEMIPFLKGLFREGDTKERDKLVAKFVRVVKEKDGMWWFPRRNA